MRPRVLYKGLPGFKLIPVTSAELTPFVASRAITALEPILPYSIIVRNDTTKRLRMISVRTYLTNAKGAVITNDIVIGATTVPAVMFEPGSMVLITPPDGGLSTKLRKAMCIPEAAMLERRLVSRVEFYSRQLQVEVTLDSVVFEDGEVVGPDTMGNLVIMNSRTTAETELANEVLARHGDEIVRYLASVPEPIEWQTRTSPPDRINTSESDLAAIAFSDSRYEFAQMLLTLRPSLASEEDFTRYVRSTIEAKAPVLWRENP